MYHIKCAFYLIQYFRFESHLNRFKVHTTNNYLSLNMEVPFFISFIDKADRSLNYPYDIELERLSNYDIALHFYKENVFDEWDNIRQLKPIIITSDENLYLQYRHILSEKNSNSFVMTSCLDIKA